MVAFFSSPLLYFSLVGLVGLERLLELRLSKANARWSFSRGGVEWGRGHYVPMVLLHTGLLVFSPVEGWLFPLHAPTLFYVFMALGVCFAQTLRYWAVRSLGKHWNIRVIVVPEAFAVVSGPYRFLSHPNYVAVVLEGLCLPLLGGAWRTAVVFFCLNAWFLTVRIRCEHKALALTYSNYTDVGAGR